MLIYTSYKHGPHKFLAWINVSLLHNASVFALLAASLPITDEHMCFWNIYFVPLPNYLLDITFSQALSIFLMSKHFNPIWTFWDKAIRSWEHLTIRFCNDFLDLKIISFAFSIKLLICIHWYLITLTCNSTEFNPIEAWVGPSISVLCLGQSQHTSCEVHITKLQWRR